ncbi:hypothetical protein PV333_23385 [Streptomyces sp. NY05-11A]|nr:hypothetical protein [Streptomyces sp. NY05-11A]MDX2679265.1 hypothetical protein [Streptomyces sp. NY05-11A]
MQQNTVTAGDVRGIPGRPAADRPIRFTDPARNAAYWARIVACVDSAPPLSAEQRAVIRTAFSTVTTSAKEAA